jgi:hypothetical protein
LLFIFCRLKINHVSHEFILEFGTIANTKLSAFCNINTLKSLCSQLLEKLMLFTINGIFFWKVNNQASNIIVSMSASMSMTSVHGHGQCPCPFSVRVPVHVHFHVNYVHYVHALVQEKTTLCFKILSRLPKKHLISFYPKANCATF